MTTARIKRKPDLIERRKAERYDIHVPVHVSVVKILRIYEPPQVFETKDVSSRGAFLYAYPPLRSGARLKIEIHLSFQKLRDIFGADRRLIINLRGRVVRVEGNGMAVRFGGFYRMETVLRQGKQ